MDQSEVTIEVEGVPVTAGSSSSIIEAIWSAGHTLVTNVGCLGQGVCGSCRVMATRRDSHEVDMELACETVVEDGMRVAFVAHLAPQRERHLDLERVRDSWELGDELSSLFPEAEAC
ncbi:MAG: 2Fe-2S iron-sulfur cluster-binding protein [Ilumatobacteraceae bacterium]